VVEHKEEKMYVPTLIFGHLLTSSNYNDFEKKVTGKSYVELSMMFGDLWKTWLFSFAFHVLPHIVCDML